MTVRSVAHGSFCIERRYPSSRRRVYGAFSNPEIKKAWSCHENWTSLQMEVREGGREISRGGPPGGPTYTFSGQYYDVVEDERLVFAYEMHREDVRVSVSVCTIEFRDDGAGTLLVFTEHGAFLDGEDDPAEREHGSNVGLDNLAAWLAANP